MVAVDEGGELYLDSQVAQGILQVIHEAKETVIVVSPYLRLWDDAKKAIRAAKKRRVNVTLILREDDEERQAGRLDIEWLKSNKVDCVRVPNLHAKIYLNEDTVLLSSMNLTNSSLENCEVAYKVTDAFSQNRIRQRVENLMANFSSSKTFCARCGKANRLRSHSTAQDLPLCLTCYEEWKKANDLK